MDCNKNQDENVGIAITRDNCSCNETNEVIMDTEVPSNQNTHASKNVWDKNQDENVGVAITRDNCSCNETNEVVMDTEVPSVQNTHASKNVWDKSLNEVQNHWNQWTNNNPPIYVSSVAGIVGSLLLKAVAGQVGKKLLKSLNNLLFPANEAGVITMEEILRAVEEMIDQKLSEQVYNDAVLELNGLKRNIQTFFEDINNLQNRVIVDQLEEEDTPKGIIDSINTLNQFFVNRIEKFKHPTYKVVLLPLFAQVANLHIGFLKDVIDNAQEWGLSSNSVKLYTNRFLDAISSYSNYCITTFQLDFQGKFSKKFHEVLSYRNFMILNVLDYTGLWSMLRFDNLVIATSKHLYAVGHNRSNERYNPQFNYGAWPNFNRIFQGFPNRELNSINVKSNHFHQYYYSNPVGIDMISETICNISSNYSGGKSIRVGYECTGPQSGPGVTWFHRTKELSDIRNLELHSAALNVNYSSRNTGYTSYLRDLRNLRLRNASSEYNLIDGSGYPEWTEFPDFKIRNIIGLKSDMAAPDTNIIDGPANQYNGTGDLATSVVSFQRRDWNPYSLDNGTIQHAIHLGYGFDGVAISPLEYSSTFNVGGRSRFVIHERHGNPGDALVIPKTNGGYSHGFYYKLYNPYGYTEKVEVFIKVSAITPTTLKCYLNGWGVVREISTNSNNDGIVDNGQKSKILKVLSNYDLPANQSTLAVYNGGTGDMHIESIIIIKSGKRFISRL
ncbi:insecticidal delta-endotoxin Cry8Ea1 family protein [Bacillus cereus group sp. BfR-BA-01349]|uniref:insecticidal delta-endotoxin Cry8Ea1 family protein n=1 Tax=Bacillus cereus group sp. BfR-BA-01349 TaxID=2920312 RepID=UPI001F59CFF0